MNASQEKYVFENLIHANENSDRGQTIKVEPAESFSTKNAPGIIAPMSFDDISARATAFGARCKKAMS